MYQFHTPWKHQGLKKWNTGLKRDKKVFKLFSSHFWAICDISKSV